MRLLVALAVLLGLTAASLSVGFWAAERWSPEPAAPTVTSASSETSTSPAPDLAPAVEVSWSDGTLRADGRLAGDDADALAAALGRLVARDEIVAEIDLVGDASVVAMGDASLDAAVVTVPVLVRTVPTGTAILTDTGWDLALQVADAATADAVVERLGQLGGIASVDVEVVGGAQADLVVAWGADEPAQQRGDAPVRLATVLVEFGVRPALDAELTYEPTAEGALGVVAELVGDGSLVAGSVRVVGPVVELDARVADRATLERVEGVLAGVDALSGPGVRLVDPVALDESLADGSLAAGLRFVEGSTRFADDALATLDELADLLDDLPAARLRIVGHTDDRGNAAANAGFSLAQAEAVAAALIERGIDPDRLETVGAGESEPIADNATAAGRAANLRIELVSVSPVR